MASNVAFPLVSFTGDFAEQKSDAQIDVHPAKTHVSRFKEQIALQERHPQQDIAFQLGLPVPVFNALEQIRKDMEKIRGLFDEYSEEIDEQSVLQFYCAYFNPDDGRFNGNQLPRDLITQIQSISRFIASNTKKIAIACGVAEESAQPCNLSVLQDAIEQNRGNDRYLLNRFTDLNERYSSVDKELQATNAKIESASDAERLALSEIRSEYEKQLSDLQKNCKETICAIKHNNDALNRLNAYSRGQQQFNLEVLQHAIELKKSKDALMQKRRKRFESNYALKEMEIRSIAAMMEQASDQEKMELSKNRRLCVTKCKNLGQSFHILNSEIQQNLKECSGLEECYKNLQLHGDPNSLLAKVRCVQTSIESNSSDLPG